MYYVIPTPRKIISLFVKFSFFIYVYVCVYFILTGFIVVPTQTSHLSFTYTFYRVCFRISFKFKLIYCKVQAVNYFTVISEVAVLTLFQGNLKYLLQNICYKNKWGTGSDRVEKVYLNRNFWKLSRIKNYQSTLQIVKILFHEQLCVYFLGAIKMFFLAISQDQISLQATVKVLPQ